MAEQQFYLRMAGKVMGPFERGQLKALCDRGQLRRFHEVSQDRRTWFSASSLTELFPAEAAPEPAARQAEPAVVEAGPAAPPAWYYIDAGGNSQGPISAEHFWSLHRSGTIGDATLVWQEGMKNWAAFSSLAEMSSPSKNQRADERLKQKQERAEQKRKEQKEGRKRALRHVHEATQDPAAPTTATKRCPYCAEAILVEARKCKYCGELLELGHVAEKIVVKQSSGDNAAGIIGLVLGCISGVLLVGTCCFGLWSIFAAVPFAVIGFIVSLYGSGTTGSLGRALNLLVLIIAVVLLVIGVATIMAFLGNMTAHP